MTRRPEKRTLVQSLTADVGGRWGHPGRARSTLTPCTTRACAVIATAVFGSGSSRRARTPLVVPSMGCDTLGISDELLVATSVPADQGGVSTGCDTGTRWTIERRDVPWEVTPVVRNRAR